MRAVILVPYRAGDPVRDASWRYAFNWWNKLGYEIVIGEHPGPEPFNRAKALNRAARQAWPWDVAVCIDADVVEDREEQVTRAIVTAWDTGKLVVAHTEGRDLDERATKWILDGKRDFDWFRQTREVRSVCLSRANVFRSDLFERMGGWDERFSSWGFEDSSMYLAAVAAAGPLVHVPGCSWHLFHPPVLPEARKTEGWQKGKDLFDRYRVAVQQGWPAVQSLLDERTEDERYVPPFPVPMPPMVHCVADLVVITSGRREYLEQTLASVAEHLKGEIAQRIMVDDSGDETYAAYLDATYPEFTIIHHEQNLGYSVTMKQTREYIRDTEGAPFVAWWEDDFVLCRDISLDEMATLLTNEDLAQVVLLRQAWKAEVAAGGIVQQHPESYHYSTHRGIRYLQHQRFFSSNPNLARRELFSHPWPEGAHTESRFGKELVEQGLSFAFLGWGSSPDVTHIGEVRGGHGY